MNLPSHCWSCSNRFSKSYQARPPPPLHPPGFPRPPFSLWPNNGPMPHPLCQWEGNSNPPPGTQLLLLRLPLHNLKTTISEVWGIQVLQRGGKMPSLLATCEELFNTRNLYEVLALEKTANNSQIKKAYHKVIRAEPSGLNTNSWLNFWF